MKCNCRKWLTDLLVAAVLIALSIVLLRTGYRHYVKISYPLAYTEQVTAYAEQFDLPPSLIYGVIHTESRFDPRAQSHVGAKGLMQLMDVTFEWTQSKLGESGGDVFDPDTNIRNGTKLLSYLCGEFETTETALAAYNAGIGNVRNWLKDGRYSADGKTLHTIPFSETAAYVTRVTEAQTMYQTLYEIV